MRIFSVIVGFSLVVSSARADWTPTWALGVADGSANEFGSAASPAEYTVGQDFSNLRGRWSTNADQSSVSIRFTLSESESSPDAALRLLVSLTEAQRVLSGQGTWQGQGWHELTLRINGEIWETREDITGVTTWAIFGRAIDIGAVAGENILEIERSGGSTHFSQIGLDALRLEADPSYYSDPDQDGMHSGWERKQGLDPTDPSDAGKDPDQDSLSMLDEYYDGSDPWRSDTDGDGVDDGEEARNVASATLVDTDGDGLTDFSEIKGSLKSDPTRSDTDGDGAPDGWEQTTGHDPNDPNDTPPAFAGAIGLQFVSAYAPQAALNPLQVTGPYSQLGWNVTSPLPPDALFASGLDEVRRPVAGSLLLNDGSASGANISWTGNGVETSANRGTLTGKLLNGLLTAIQDGSGATVSINGIPFNRYDVYVGLGAEYNLARGTIGIVGQPDTDRVFMSASIAPQDKWIPAKSIPSEIAQAIAGVDDPLLQRRLLNRATRSATYVHFEGLTSSDIQLRLTSQSGTTGISSIQIVDVETDTDDDGMPDSWEIVNGLDLLAADVESDSDNDGLIALLEYERNGDPRQADTDGDGVTDGQEGGGLLNAHDSDSDGISDSDEPVAWRPTLPEVFDTDGDGVGDGEEQRRGSDPLSAASETFPLPQYDAATQTWRWEINAQIVWDHGEAGLTPNPWDDGELVMFAASPSSAGYLNAWNCGLLLRGGTMTWQLSSNATYGFSEPFAPGQNLLRRDFTSPTRDLRAVFGFSGIGRRDISRRLQFLTTAKKQADGSGRWTVTFQISSIDLPPGEQEIVSLVIENCEAAGSVDDGSATWVAPIFDPSTPPVVFTPEGVDVVYDYPALESLPAFADSRDTDDDGLPDTWETNNGLSPTEPNDPNSDVDGDLLGLVNEYRLGLNPQSGDTDGDGASDSEEFRQGSDPRSASSRPAFYLAPPNSGGDFNGDGFPDVWQTRYGAYEIDPQGDSDDDGISDREEAIAGSDPFEYGVAPEVTLHLDGAQRLAIAPQLPGKRYRIRSSADLSDWLVSEWETPGTEWETESSRNFFVLETGSVDSDGDGLEDWDELWLGSDPSRAESVGVSLPSNGIGRPIVGGDYAAAALRFLDEEDTPDTLSPVLAARFLTQATFGVTQDSIDQVRQLGYAGWISRQRSLPASKTTPYARELYDDYYGEGADDSYYRVDFENFLPANNLTTSFFRNAVTGKDQLRQRVAFALSQILVISKRDGEVGQRLLGMSDYYDTLIEHSFGNYLDLLREVTWHPCMGRYLSHVGNEPSSENRHPDENFARELMQLFTIGLWELEPDGTRKLDASGEPIPTYNNNDVTALARVFTGQWFAGNGWKKNGFQDEHYAVPMDFFPEYHDYGAKSFLGNIQLPARWPTEEEGRADIDAALRGIFQHPNLPVFISKQLIQFLVTSNPSPGYIRRIQDVFVDDGNGQRGNLGAVVEAILLDSEARDVSIAIGDPTFGKLREPILRATQLARLGGLDKRDDLLWWNPVPGHFESATLQDPLNSPSVFNFYRPDYSPPGIIGRNGLVEPVFQITNTYSAVATPAKFWEIIEGGFAEFSFYRIPMDWTLETALAGTPPLLMDHLNRMLCGGRLSAASRDIILGAINALPAENPAARARLALELVIAAPESAIQR